MLQRHTQAPYGFLVVDLNASTPEAFRLGTGLFPPELPTFTYWGRGRGEGREEDWCLAINREESDCHYVLLLVQAWEHDVPVSEE